jgi:hypothetical protein
VRRFQPARTLDLVTAEDFRIGDNDQFCRVANETPREGAEMDEGLCLVRQAELLPNFLKALALAVVVAEDMNGKILPLPAVQLLEEFPPLRLGNLRLRCALGQRPKGVERRKLRTGGGGGRPREPSL